MKFYLIMSALALADGNMPAPNPIDLSGQGVPRETEADCQKAAKALTDKLSKKSFSQITTSCVGTNEDVGGFVPVIHAKHAMKHTLNQGIGQRLSDLQTCAKELNQMKSGLSDVLESECLKGRETDFKGNSKDFYQPWLSNLIVSGDESKKGEADKRDTKSLNQRGTSPTINGIADSCSDKASTLRLNAHSMSCKSKNIKKDGVR